MQTHFYKLALALIALIALVAFLVAATYPGGTAPAEAWAQRGAFALVMSGFFAVIQTLGGKK